MEAKLISKTVEYKDGDQVLAGIMVYDAAIKNKKPTVLIVPNWMGISDETKSKAEFVAKLGYIAFAVDMYGKGNKPKNSEEAGKFMENFKNNREALSNRAHAAIEYLKTEKNVDVNKLAAIGFCFGGTIALEMARNGEDLKAVVSFHGGLATDDVSLAKNIKGKVLVLHGAIDPFVKPEEVNTFLKEMNDAKVDYELVHYGGVVHSFTDKTAGTDISKGTAYNEKVEAKSLKAMQELFEEVF